MVRRDAVTKQAQDSRPADVLDRPRRPRDPVEVGRTADVRGLGIPHETVALRDREAGPTLVALEDLAILLVEHRGLDRAADQRVHLAG